MPKKPVQQKSGHVAKEWPCGDGRPREPALSEVEGSGRAVLGDFLLLQRTHHAVIRWLRMIIRVPK